MGCCLSRELRATSKLPSRLDAAIYARCTIAVTCALYPPHYIHVRYGSPAPVELLRWYLVPQLLARNFSILRACKVPLQVIERTTPSRHNVRRLQTNERPVERSPMVSLTFKCSINAR